MFNVPTLFAAAGLLALPFGAAPAAAALLINVQFTGQGAPVQSGAAVIGQRGDAWNGLGGHMGGAALRDSTGAATGITLSFSAPGAYMSPLGDTRFAGTATNNLMSGYLYSRTTAPVTATLSGLVAGQAFTLYAITQGDMLTGGRTNVLTVNGVTQTNVNSNASGYIRNDNFALFSGVADARGQIFLSDVNGRGEANLNGFQLQTAPVPEPATWAMMIGGFAMVGFVVRRRGAADGTPDEAAA